jgi:hypothetical protein
VEITLASRILKSFGMCVCVESTTTTSSDHWLTRDALRVVDKVRDTLLHEMCHAAEFLINGTTGDHSPAFYAWAARAERAFPGIPKVTRCHNYEIDYEYKYQCTNVLCGQVYVLRASLPHTETCLLCATHTSCSVALHCIAL